MAALEILEEEPWRIDKLKSNADYMRAGLKAQGYTVIDGITGIVPVVLGVFDKTLIFWRKLFDAGVFTNAFVPPGVPPNLSMLRTSYMVSHEKEHLDRILELFGEIGKELELIK